MTFDMLSFSFVSLALLALEATAAIVHLPPKPTKLSLTARKFSESDLSRRTLKPATLPLEEYFNLSDLQCVTCLSWKKATRL